MFVCNEEFEGGCQEVVMFKIKIFFSTRNEFNLLIVSLGPKDSDLKQSISVDMFHHWIEGKPGIQFHSKITLQKKSVYDNYFIIKPSDFKMYP